MGKTYEYGDAQNSAIRVFLYQLSKKLSIFFSDEYKQKTLEYFNYKCPYSEEDISDGKFDEDHVVPLNREHCGLHVYGNILLVKKEANRAKRQQSLEKFLKNETAKLERIQKFREQSGFTNIYEEYNEQLKQNCKSLYKKVREVIEGNFNVFIDDIKMPDNRNNLVQTQPVSSQHMSLKSSVGVKNTSQAALLTKPSCIPPTSEPKIGKNKYYIFPKDEFEFKNEAFKGGEIFVRVIHPDGYEDIKVRQVDKMWKASVYSNISTMLSRGLKLCQANNLVVYACPIKYKDLKVFEDT